MSTASALSLSSPLDGQWLQFRPSTDLQTNTAGATVDPAVNALRSPLSASHGDSSSHCRTGPFPEPEPRHEDEANDSSGTEHGLNVEGSDMVMCDQSHTSLLIDRQVVLSPSSDLDHARSLLQTALSFTAHLGLHHHRRSLVKHVLLLCQFRLASMVAVDSRRWLYHRQKLIRSTKMTLLLLLSRPF